VTHYFDWRQLENLNYDNPDVRAYVTAAFVHWARDFGVDGFRVDAAWAVEQRAPQFWQHLRSELRRVNPELLMIAEASALDPRYAAQGFDAAYDWSLDLGQWAWQSAFAGEKAPDLAQLRAALARSTAHDSSTGTATIRVFRFLNNNDTGVRFLTRHGPQETLSAMTLMFTLPGWPSIYEGDEQGVAFEPYRAGVSVPWGSSGGVFTGIYRRLAELRRLQPALRSSELRMVSTDHETSVLAFLRPGDCAARAILVLLNFGANAGEVRLRDALPARCQQHPDRSSTLELDDLLTGDVITAGTSLPAIHMEAHQSRILRLD
jgi:glycosidase